MSITIVSSFRGAPTLWLLLSALMVPVSTLNAAGWSQTPWQVNCVDPNPCAPIDDYYENYLAYVSNWLDGLGFRQPRSASPVDSSGNYVEGIYIAEVRGLNPPPIGQGSLPLADPGPPAIPGVAYDDQEIRRWFNTRGDPVAALFTAVESSYVSSFFLSPNSGNSIFKAMPIAVRQAWLQKTSYSDTTEHYRSYAVRLDQPDSLAAALGTWYFWTEVGSQINSPEQIAWLHDVLSAEQTPGGPDLNSVDEALRPHGGLAKQLLKFFARLSTQDMQVFNPYSHSAHLPNGVEEREFRFQHAVQKLAGRGAFVAVSSGTGEKVKVEISIEPDDADLHLIVGGQPRDQGSGESRNRYVDELEGGASETYEIVVANINEHPDGTVYKVPALVVKLSTEEEADCCACVVGEVQQFTGSNILPCTFDHPLGWEGAAGNDGGLVSAVVGPACGGTCVMGPPDMGFTVAMREDRNADAMEAMWRQIMPVVGSGSCAGSNVTFYAPPGSDPQGLMGGVKFYLEVDGKKYAGGATFSCGEPGKWVKFQELFIDSFTSYPGSIFPGD